MPVGLRDCAGQNENGAHPEHHQGYAETMSLHLIFGSGHAVFVEKLANGDQPRQH
ncbi:hypothetical protein SAMN05877838_2831 [Hoeflea halophila]|uniref:Uncharacterized protein n=1 Tax=Hoeflea halophila TaxID=714899 RepID=A0A286IE51_9HYPH|nr:hypothetical protein SAMN05877838_2831 [Hoeflea halophila]